MLQGLHKNNCCAVSCVGTYFPFNIPDIYFGISHGVTFNLIPNFKESFYGQISIETATYSYTHALSDSQLHKALWVSGTTSHVAVLLTQSKTLHHK